MPTIGTIYHVPGEYIGINHGKFALCICDERSLFFYINTKSYEFKSDAQVKVLGKLELPFLDHASYIDTSQFQVFSADAIAHAESKGPLPRNIIERVISTINKHGHLSPESRLYAVERLSSCL